MNRQPSAPQARARTRVLMRGAGLAFSSVLLGALAVACDSGEGEDRPNVEVIGGAGSVSVSGVVEGYGEPLYEPSTDQSLELAIGLDLKSLRAIMSQAVSGGGVDWAAALEIYEEGENQRRPDGSIRTLADLAADPPLTAFPDAEAVYGSTSFIDEMIRDGLTGTGRAEGLEDNPRRQLVDKGIQALMYAQATALLAEASGAMAAGDESAAARSIDAAWASLAGERDETGTPNNGLLATALGREDDYTFQGEIARPLEASLFAALTAAQQADRDRLESKVAESQAHLNTVFYLSVLRYAPVLERDARTSDRATHLAEAWAFFQAIRAQVAAASPEAAEVVEAAYSRPAAEPFPDEAVDDIFEAMNDPDVLAALNIPDQFHIQTP